MMAKKATHTPVRQNVFGATLARFVGKRRSPARPRLSGLRKCLCCTDSRPEK
jgi:hypothetical protein